MPKKCAKMRAFMGISAASVALHGSWYEPSKVPTEVNPYNYPSKRIFSDSLDFLDPPEMLFLEFLVRKMKFF